MFAEPPLPKSDGLDREESTIFDPTFSLASRLSQRTGSLASGAFRRKGSKSSSVTNEDVQLERRFGLRNEQVREFGMLETFSFAMTIISVSSNVAATLDTPLLLGGPASVVWCWGVGALMNMSTAISISELISAYPTCGGLYSASAWLVPKRYRAITGWVCGYLNTIGQVAGVASTEFALSSMVWAGVLVAKDGDFEVTKAKQYGLYAGLLLVHGVLNSLPTSQLAVMTRGFVFVNTAVCLIAILVLLFLTPISQMNSPEWVFTYVENGTNYHDGVAFLLGLLSVSWTLTDYDAVAHISFEVKQAALSAPAALTVAVAATGSLGFVLNVVLMFCAPPLDTLPGMSKLSFLHILLYRIGKAGALLLWIIVCFVGFFTVHVSLHANSRSVFAFSRDRALPDKQVLGRLSSTTRTPLLAVWALVAVSLLLGAMHFVSPQAAKAIFSMCAVALDLSYVVPIICRRMFAKHDDVMYRPGPFSLGEPWSYIVNVVMVSWTLFAVIILSFPTVTPFTAGTFNWSWVITLGILLISVVWFYLRAHRTYVGPLRDIVSPSPVQPQSDDGGTLPSRTDQMSFSQLTSAGGGFSRNRFSSRGSVPYPTPQPPVIAINPASSAVSVTSPRTEQGDSQDPSVDALEMSGLTSISSASDGRS